MKTENEVEDVLFYFYNNNDNRSAVIAKKLNINLSKVSQIIELDLSKKRNYMPSLKVERKGSIKNRKPIRAYNDDDKLLGEFPSLLDCAKKLGVNPGCISKYLSGLGGDGLFITHKGQRKIRYELL